MTGFRKDKQTEADKQAGREKVTDRQTDKQRAKTSSQERWLVGWFSFIAGCFYGWLFPLMFGCSSQLLLQMVNYLDGKLTGRQEERWLVGSILQPTVSTDAYFYGWLGRDRQTGRQRERGANRYTDCKKTDNRETGRKNDDWLVQLYG